MSNQAYVKNFSYHNSPPKDLKLTIYDDWGRAVASFKEVSFENQDIAQLFIHSPALARACMKALDTFYHLGEFVKLNPTQQIVTALRLSHELHKALTDAGIEYNPPTVIAQESKDGN